jgi:predicted nucleic acid-binding protein
VILVDSSVLIDLLRGRDTLQTAQLDRLLVAEQEVAIGDLMIVEVLQGTRDAHQLELYRRWLSEFHQILISDASVAIQAARNYQHLRALGITVRKTIDTLIATRCILDSVPLLYSDRDFDPFVEHLGLISALDASGVN